MQRRAAAAYVVFFVVLGASAFSVMALAEHPHVDIDGDAYSQGDTFTVGDREYTVSELGTEESGGGGHGGGGSTSYVGTLTWTEENARYTATLKNNSTVPARLVQWEGQTARYTATLSDGDTVRYQSNATTVEINASSNFTLVRGNESATFEEGDEFPYRANTTTVENIGESEVRLVWGTYHLPTPESPNGTNGTDPATFHFVERPNVTAILVTDPAVYNDTVTVDGTESVVYRSNNSTVPLDSYLPELEEKRFDENESFTYRPEGFNDTEVTVYNVTTTGVVIEWTAPREHEVELAEGANVTLNDREYVVHFESENEVLLSQDRAGYQQDVREQSYFTERMNGLKGILILSGSAAVLLLGMAYLPRRG